MWPNCCPRAEGTETTDSSGDQKVHFASRAPLAQTGPTTPWHRSLAHPGAARGRKPPGLGGHLQFPGARCQCPRPGARGRRVQKDTRPRQRVWFALGPSPGMRRGGEGRYGRKREGIVSEISIMRSRRWMTTGNARTRSERQAKETQDQKTKGK